MKKRRTTHDGAREGLGLGKDETEADAKATGLRNLNTVASRVGRDKSSLAHIVDRIDVRWNGSRAVKQIGVKKGDAKSPAKALTFDQSRDGSMQFSRHSPVSKISCWINGTPVSLRCIRPTSISTARPPILAGS